MSNEEIQEVLDELQLVRPEKLKPDARRLFNCMMTIADDRDKYLKENQKLKEDINFCLHSIKQEMDMSKDERTRKEMTSCYDILSGDENDKNT